MSGEVAFWTVQTLAALAVPILIHLCTWRLTADRTASWVAGALAVLYMADEHPVASFGITLQATFGVGLSTQLLAFVWVLAFFYFLLDAERRRASRILASLFFAAVPLTNVHVVWNAAFLFVGVAVTRLLTAATASERWRSARRYAGLGGGAVLMSMVWILPMLARLDYVPTMALDPPPFGLVLHAFFRLAVYLLLAAAIARFEGRHDVLALVASLLALIAFSALPTLSRLEDLAIQPGRILIAFQFLSTILVGYLIGSVRKVTRRRWAPAAAGALAVAVFYAYIEPVDEPASWISPVAGTEYEAILETLAGRVDGRVLIEMGSGGPSDYFALQALAGRSGLASLTTVFRESAVNSLFAVPLRNSVAARTESFGIDSKMPDPSSFKGQSAEQHLARLRAFNVRYFAFKSPRSQRWIEDTLPVEPLATVGEWRLYALREPAAGFAAVPDWEPVLTFARFSVKRRAEYALDFVRLGEEMFAAGRLEVPLVLAPGGLDGAGDAWERFRMALVVDYAYDDAGAAYERLEAFSRERPLVFVESDDPLAERLRALAAERPWVRSVPRTSEEGWQDFMATARQELAAEREARLRRARSAAARRGEDPVTGRPVAGRPVARRDVPPPTPGEVRSRAERLAVRDESRRLFDALDALRRPVETSARVTATRVSSARLGHRGAEIELDRAPERPVPVWIRQGFLPNWRREEGPSEHPVYLATPTFQLTFAEGRRIRLRFAPVAAQRAGAVLALLGLLLILTPWRRTNRSPSPPPPPAAPRARQPPPSPP